ncbi:zinc finger (CCCH type) motif-containing protein [Toxoplasma gondii GAB2-2007-GAL-DOM2]|uniref:Zinc finger (CCCH type) motif-containing protein n=2 Tax=Toxoplasma gondii TaxID=5811 RepID=A0A086JNP6_TOXGO|nr:zinc finger (CCCH type) motif-containing protein [Toxoplasma gondii FOU]KFG40661.1 zinc finger (CCCH type) motif-containing protein [Toxoplasma gondii GAB2-2007-GAL-DOM2]
MMENSSSSSQPPCKVSQAVSLLSFPQLSLSTKPKPSLLTSDAGASTLADTGLLPNRGDKPTKPSLSTSTGGALSYRAVAARAVSQRPAGHPSSDTETDCRRDSERACEDDRVWSASPGDAEVKPQKKPAKRGLHRGTSPRDEALCASGSGTPKNEEGSRVARSASPLHARNSKGEGGKAVLSAETQTEKAAGGKGEKKPSVRGEGGSHGKRKQRKPLDLRLAAAGASDLPVFDKEGEKEAHLTVMLRPGNRKRRSCVDAVSGCLLFWGVRCPSKFAGASNTWCAEGDKCLACHTDAEYFGHPAVYKTVLCSNLKNNSSRSCCFSANAGGNSATGASPRKRGSEALLSCGRVRCCCWKAHTKAELRTELAKKYTLTGLGKLPSPLAQHPGLSGLEPNGAECCRAPGATSAKDSTRADASSSVSGGGLSRQTRRASLSFAGGALPRETGGCCLSQDPREGPRSLCGFSGASEKPPKKTEDKRSEEFAGTGLKSVGNSEKTKDSAKDSGSGDGASRFHAPPALWASPKGPKGTFRDDGKTAACDGNGACDSKTGEEGEKVERASAACSWRECTQWRGTGAKVAGDTGVPLAPVAGEESGKGKATAGGSFHNAGVPSADGIGPANVFLPDGSLDLDLFKVFPCRHRNVLHERKSCPFYHNYRDKRRAPVTYQAEQCEEQFDLDTATIQCSKGDNCERCHNRHELLYHPNIYKQRFCSNFSQTEKGGSTTCARGVFCAFAHSRAEIRATLFTEQEEKEPDCQFFVAKFKTVWCPYGSQHDWHTCVYAHTYQDCRRAPAIGYGSEPCPSWSKDLHSADYDRRCPHGARCSFSHGSKEQLYHPSYYKTMPCMDYRPQSGDANGKSGEKGRSFRHGGSGSSGGCPRGFLCAFYHEVTERRLPVPPCSTPGWTFSYSMPLPLSQLKLLQPLFLEPPLFNLDDFEAFGHHSRLTAASRRAGAGNGSEGPLVSASRAIAFASPSEHQNSNRLHRTGGVSLGLVSSGAFSNFSVSGPLCANPPGSSPKALALAKGGTAPHSAGSAKPSAMGRRRSSFSSYSTSYGASFAAPAFAPPYSAGVQGQGLEAAALGPLEAGLGPEGVCGAFDGREDLHALAPQLESRRRIGPCWSAGLAEAREPVLQKKDPARRLSQGSVQDSLCGAAVHAASVGSGSVAALREGNDERREDLHSWSEPTSCFPTSFEPASGLLAPPKREQRQEHLLLQVAAMLLNGASQGETETFVAVAPEAEEDPEGEELGHTFSVENAEAPFFVAQSEFLADLALGNPAGFSEPSAAPEEDGKAVAEYAPALFTPHGGDERVGAKGSLAGPRDTLALGTFLPAFPGDPVASGLSKEAVEARANDKALAFSGVVSRGTSERRLRGSTAKNASLHALAVERRECHKTFDSSALLLPFAAGTLSSSSPPCVSSGGFSVETPDSLGEAGMPGGKATHVARRLERDETEVWSTSTEGGRGPKGGPTPSQGDLWSSPSLETLASRGDGEENACGVLGARPVEKGAFPATHGRRFMRLFDNGNVWGPSTRAHVSEADAQLFAPLSFSAPLSSSPPGIFAPDGMESKTHRQGRSAPHNLEISILQSAPAPKKESVWGGEEEGDVFDPPAFPGSSPCEGRPAASSASSSSLAVFCPASRQSSEDSTRRSSGGFRGHGGSGEGPVCPLSVSNLWGAQWRPVEAETAGPSQWGPLASSAPPGLLRTAARGQKGVSGDANEASPCSYSSASSSHLCGGDDERKQHSSSAVVTVGGASLGRRESSSSSDIRGKKEELRGIPTAAVTAVETAAAALWGAFEEDEDERRRDSSGSPVALSTQKAAGNERLSIDRKQSFLEEAMSALWKMKSREHTEQGDDQGVDAEPLVAKPAHGDKTENRHGQVRGETRRHMRTPHAHRPVVLAVCAQDEDTQVAYLKSLLCLRAWSNVILYVSLRREQTRNPEISDSALLQTLAALSKETVRYHVSHLCEEELSAEELDAFLATETEDRRRLLIVYGKRDSWEVEKDGSRRSPVTGRDTELSLSSENSRSLFSLLRLRRKTDNAGNGGALKSLAVIGLHSAPAEFWRVCHEAEAKVAILGNQKNLGRKDETEETSCSQLLPAASHPKRSPTGSSQPVGAVVSAQVMEKDAQTFEDSSAVSTLADSPSIVIHLVVSPSPLTLVSSEGQAEGGARNPSVGSRKVCLLPATSLPLWSCLFASPSSVLSLSRDAETSAEPPNRSFSCAGFFPETKSEKPSFEAGAESPTSRSVGEDLTAVTAAGSVDSPVSASPSVCSLPSVSEIRSLSPALRPLNPERSAPHSHAPHLSLPAGSGLSASAAATGVSTIPAAGTPPLWGGSSLPGKRPVRGDERSVSAETAVTMATAASSTALTDDRAEDSRDCGEKETRKSGEKEIEAKKAGRTNQATHAPQGAKEWRQGVEGADDYQEPEVQNLFEREVLGELLLREMRVVGKTLRREGLNGGQPEKVVFCWAPLEEQSRKKKTGCERPRSGDVINPLSRQRKDAASASLKAGPKPEATRSGVSSLGVSESSRIPTSSLSPACDSCSSLRVLTQDLLPTADRLQRLLFLVAERGTSRPHRHLFSRLSVCGQDSVFFLPSGDKNGGVRVRQHSNGSSATVAVRVNKSPAAPLEARVRSPLSGSLAFLSLSRETRYLTLTQLVRGCPAAHQLDLSRCSPFGDWISLEKEFVVRPMLLRVSHAVTTRQNEADDQTERPQQANQERKGDAVSGLWCALCGETLERSRNCNTDQETAIAGVPDTRGAEREVCCFVRCGYTPEEKTRELDCPHLFHRFCLDAFLAGPEYTRTGGRCFCHAFVHRPALRSTPTRGESGEGQTHVGIAAQRRWTSFLSESAASPEESQKADHGTSLRFPPASRDNESTVLRRTDESSEHDPELSVSHAVGEQKDTFSSFFSFTRAVSPSGASFRQAAVLCEGSEEDAATVASASPQTSFLCPSRGVRSSVGRAQYCTSLATPPRLPELLREVLLGLAEAQDLHMRVALHEATKEAFSEKAAPESREIGDAKEQGDTSLPRFGVSPSDIWVATRVPALQRSDRHAAAVSTCVDIFGSSLLPAFVSVCPGRLLRQNPRVLSLAAARLVFFVCSGGVAGAWKVQAGSQREGDVEAGLRGMYEIVSNFPPLLQHLLLLLSGAGPLSQTNPLHAADAGSGDFVAGSQELLEGESERHELPEEPAEDARERRAAFPDSFLLLSDVVHHPFFWSNAQKLDFLDKVQFALSHACASPRAASRLSPPTSLPCDSLFSGDATEGLSANEKRQNIWRACVENLAEGWRGKVHKTLLEAVDVGLAGEWRGAEGNLTAVSTFSNDLDGLLRFVKTLRMSSLSVSLKVLTSSAVADLVHVYVHPMGAATGESRGASAFAEQRARRILLQNFDNVVLEQVNQVHPRLFLLLFAYLTSSFEADDEMEGIFDFLADFALTSKPFQDSFWFDAVVLSEEKCGISETRANQSSQR